MQKFVIGLLALIVLVLPARADDASRARVALALASASATVNLPAIVPVQVADDTDRVAAAKQTLAVEDPFADSQAMAPTKAREKHQHAAYVMALAQSQSTGKPLCVGVNMDAPVGDWLTCRIDEEEFGGVSGKFCVVSKDGNWLTHFHDATSAKITAALSSHGLGCACGPDCPCSPCLGNCNAAAAYTSVCGPNGCQLVPTSNFMGGGGCSSCAGGSCGSCGQQGFQGAYQEFQGGGCSSCGSGGGMQVSGRGHPVFRILTSPVRFLFHGRGGRGGRGGCCGGCGG